MNMQLISDILDKGEMWRSHKRNKRYRKGNVIMLPYPSNYQLPTIMVHDACLINLFFCCQPLWSCLRNIGCICRCLSEYVYNTYFYLGVTHVSCNYVIYTSFYSKFNIYLMVVCWNFLFHMAVLNYIKIPIIILVHAAMSMLCQYNSF